MSLSKKPMDISSPTLHLTVTFSLSVFFIALLMSIFFHVEIVARGQGRVVPVTRVQVVQPEFSGRIVSIHVSNGSEVQQGDVLVKMDTTDSITQMGVIAAERDRLIVEKARVIALSSVLAKAEHSGNMMQAVLTEFHVPAQLVDSHIVVEERELLKAETADVLTFYEQLNARKKANRRSEIVTRSNIDRIKASLKFQSQRLKTASKLLEQGTNSRSSFLDTQQEYTELQQSRYVYIRELDQKIAERATLETERRRFIAETRSVALKRKAGIDARLAALAEEARAIERRIEVATLRAPAAGTIDQLKIFTIGGVAEAREELMRVVPTAVEIEIEALFSNQDIGFMSVGQAVNVRLDAYPSERFGFVKASVEDLAADSTEGDDGLWGYRVRITPESNKLIAGDNQYALRPGMTATVDVTTGERRIISYFFAPILRTIENSLGER